MYLKNKNLKSYVEKKKRAINRQKTSATLMYNSWSGK